MKNADVAFVKGMLPYHQEAVAMAKIQQLAEDIIATHAKSDCRTPIVIFFTGGENKFVLPPVGKLAYREELFIHLS